MKTFRGKLLVGWMNQREALQFLVKEAVPPLSEEEATNLWECYRQKVAALGNRGCHKPASAPHNLKEKMAADKIVKASRKNGERNVKGLIKLDPLDLVVHQLRIFEERAEPYIELVSDPVTKVKTCLPPPPGSRQLLVRKVVAKTIIELPHGEFRPSPKGIQQLAQHVAINAFEDSLLLWAAYHRPCALVFATYENPD